MEKVNWKYLLGMSLTEWAYFQFSNGLTKGKVEKKLKEIIISDYFTNKHLQNQNMSLDGSIRKAVSSIKGRWTEWKKMKYLTKTQMI